MLVTSASFVMLGFWQLGRHHDKQEARDEATAAYAAPAPDLLGGNAVEADTRVSVTGTYDATGEVLLRNRVRDGDGGYDVLTPMRLADGSGVLVDRGWVSRAAVRRGLDDTAPPNGTVTVRGTVHDSRPLEAADPVEQQDGRTTLPRVDLDVIGEPLTYDLRDVWITAQWQHPAPAAGDPTLPDPPESDDVNHLSYAFQWFAFATIPLIGWPIVLRRRTRRRVLT